MRGRLCILATAGVKGRFQSSLSLANANGAKTLPSPVSGASAPSLPDVSLMVGQAHGVIQRVLQLHPGHVAPVVRRSVHVPQQVVAQVATH